MNSGKPERQEAGEALTGLHLILAGLEADLRSLHMQEAVLEAKREDLREKTIAMTPLEEHNRSLQRMITELEEFMQSVESKIASLKAKAKFLGCLENVARSRNSNLALKEDLILTRLAHTLEDMDHFEPLCPPERVSRGSKSRRRGTRADQVRMEVWEGTRGHWVEVGRRVFYLHSVTGEVWLRLQ